MKIAIIAYEPLYSFIEKTIGKNTFTDIEIKMFLLDAPNCALPTFNSIKHEFDGFLVGGQALSFDIFAENNPANYFIEALSVDPLGLCKLLLKVTIENNLSDFSRVFFDFVHNESGHELVESMINSKNFLHIPVPSERNDTVKITDYNQINKYLFEVYSDMHKQNKIDFAITRYSGFSSDLDRMGIKYYFLYPSEEHIIECTQKIATRIKLANQALTSPAIIQISLPKSKLMDLEITYEQLRTLLIQYSYQCGGDFIVQQSFNGFEIYTTMRTVANITDKLTSCQLSAYLHENGFSDTIISYGMGEDTLIARSNAKIAHERSQNEKSRSAYFAQGEYYILPQARKSDDALLPLYKKISDSCKISLDMIIKIAVIPNGTEVSAHNLSQRLGVTQRSANRFLTQLSEGGYATKKGKSLSTGKGRPSDVFVLSL